MNRSITFRRMLLSDIDRILVIEQHSFSTPWTRAAFEGELRNNHFAHYYVVESENQIAGYCGMWVILDEAHITNIAIAPEFRGQKIGEALLRFMMATAVLQGAKRMTLEVRVSNAVAQNLYYKLGFVDHGIRKGYYTDNQEDALIMWAELASDQQDRLAGPR
jgi:[ribosomal protein S18]-alanine N-acetyltransferase